MIVACPDCTARFRLDAAALGAKGRRVRCGHCAHTWVQHPESNDRPGVAVTEPPPSAVAEPADPDGESWVPKRRLTRRPSAKGPPRPPVADRRRPVQTALLVALALILGIGFLGYLARDTIVQAYPRSVKLFALFLAAPTPPGDGLELTHLESERQDGGGATVLVIRGEIANPSAEPRDVPPLRGLLYGADGAELHSWRFTAPEESLLAGQFVRFQTEVRDPPIEATDLNVTFTAE